MKKNKAMRLAAVLLVVTLLSTCVVSGTFAKYVTAADGNDSASVADWGVQLTVKANNFAKEYARDDATGTDHLKTVVSTSKVVAPGTDSTETDCQASFSISGSPEVVTKVQVTLSGITDVTLPKGTYTDYTKVTGYDTSGKPTYGTFDLSADYKPVVWTLKQGTTTLKSGTLADIKTFLDAYNDDNSQCTYGANQSIAASFTLDWEWSFSTNDQADTYLGNAAAGLITSVPTGVVTTVGYTLSVTATQVD